MMSTASAYNIEYGNSTGKTKYIVSNIDVDDAATVSQINSSIFLFDNRSIATTIYIGPQILIANDTSKLNVIRGYINGSYNQTSGHQLGLYLTINNDTFAHTYGIHEGYFSSYNNSKKEELLQDMIDSFYNFFGFYPLTAGVWANEPYSISWLYDNYNISVAWSDMNRYESDALKGMSPQFPHYPTRYSLMNWADETNKIDTVLIHSSTMDELREYATSGSYAAITPEQQQQQYWRDIADYQMYNVSQYNDFSLLVINQQSGYYGAVGSGQYNNYTSLIDWIKLKDDSDISWVTSVEFADWYKSQYTGSTIYASIQRDFAENSNIFGDVGTLVQYVSPMTATKAGYMIQIYVQEDWESGDILMGNSSSTGINYSELDVAEYSNGGYFLPAQYWSSYGISRFPDGATNFTIRINNTGDDTTYYNISTHTTGSATKLKEYGNQSIVAGSYYDFEFNTYSTYGKSINVSSFYENGTSKNSSFVFYANIILDSKMSIANLRIMNPLGQSYLYNYTSTTSSDKLDMPNTVVRSFNWGRYANSRTEKDRILDGFGWDPRLASPSGKVQEKWNGVFNFSYSNDTKKITLSMNDTAGMQNWIITPEGVFTKYKINTPLNMRVSFGRAYLGTSGSTTNIAVLENADGTYQTKLTSGGINNIENIVLVKNGTTNQANAKYNDTIGSASMLFWTLYNQSDAVFSSRSYQTLGLTWSNPYYELPRWGMNLAAGQTASFVKALVPLDGDASTDTSLITPYKNLITSIDTDVENGRFVLVDSVSDYSRIVAHSWNDTSQTIIINVTGNFSLDEELYAVQVNDVWDGTYTNTSYLSTYSITYNASTRNEIEFIPQSRLCTPPLEELNWTLNTSLNCDIDTKTVDLGSNGIIKLIGNSYVDFTNVDITAKTITRQQGAASTIRFHGQNVTIRYTG